MKSNKTYISHEEATIVSFKKTPNYAAGYLNVVIGEWRQEKLLLALRGGPLAWKERIEWSHQGLITRIDIYNEFVIFAASQRKQLHV